MPLPKIIAKAVVGSIKGKKAGAATASAMAKKAAAKKVEAAKKVAAKKDAAASARGLKAAKGPSMAPKGYTADSARRAAVLAAKKMAPEGYLPREFVNELAKLQKIMLAPAPKNIVSKSGMTAKTVQLKKTAAKNKAK
jgi:hypothetical protein